MWSTLLLVTLAVSPTGEVIPESNATEVEILALYPNTVEPYNHGEFIVVHLPREQRLDNWTFRDDGPQRAKPPPVLVNGTVAFSRHPDLAARYLDIPIVELEGWFQLAVDGESVTIEIDGRAVDTVSYRGPAPQASLWVRGAGEDPWRPLGATAFEPVVARANLTAFVLPDSPDIVTSILETATDRLYLGGYTFGDTDAIETLIEAHDRGVSVAVHAEGRPVGGITEPHGEALDRLTDAGIATTVHHGPYQRWGFHHPKYAVVDDGLVVLTENWKPAGTGGNASRGWGVYVESPELAGAAAAVFQADTGWRDARPWATVREEIDRHDERPARGGYLERHPPEGHRSVNATLVVAPDNAVAAVDEVLAEATTSIHIKQVSIGDIEFPPLQRTIEAAQRGVTVRILLSSAWYVEDENRALAAELRSLAGEHDLDLEVALADETDRFDRIHAKGVIVDEQTVLLGSINWNNHSITQNREVALSLEDPAVAAYYLAVFEGDWPTGISWELPIALVLATAALAGVVGYRMRRMELEDPATTARERYVE